MSQISRIQSSAAQGAGYLKKQFTEIQDLRWGYVTHKRDKLRYSNPIAGLVFSLTNKYYCTDGCRFELPKDQTSFTYLSRCYYDLYEEEERRLIRQYIRSDDRVLELGACVGVVSCITNNLLDEHAENHVVVEPNPKLISCLEKNRSLNNAKFQIEQCLLTDQETAVFYVNDDITKGSSLETSDNEVTVKCCRLADLETQYGQFNVLIADIQGGEVDLLRMEKEALSRFRLVVIEMHPAIVGADAIEDCRRVLRECGFEMREEISDVEAWLKAD